MREAESERKREAESERKREAESERKREREREKERERERERERAWEWKEHCIILSICQVAFMSCFPSSYFPGGCGVSFNGSTTSCVL